MSIIDGTDIVEKFIKTMITGAKGTKKVAETIKKTNDERKIRKEEKEYKAQIESENLKELNDLNSSSYTKKANSVNTKSTSTGLKELTAEDFNSQDNFELFEYFDSLASDSKSEEPVKVHENTSKPIKLEQDDNDKTRYSVEVKNGKVNIIKK